MLVALVLEQETELEPTEIMTDTGAYTDVIFGIFWLLGYQFSPRLAGSLKLGLVQAGGLMITLQTHDRPTPLARALEELGRIIKTLYMLRYIDDEAYRRRILTQLNRGEGRHETEEAKRDALFTGTS